MKAGAFAISAMVLVITLVSINSIALYKSITGFIEEAESLSPDDSDAYEKANELKTRFESYERFISLTVSHDDLTNIEECYSELVGYLRVNMTDEAKVTKSRLIDALTHLRRLSGINIDSII
jgi:hypothetical protein